MFTKMNTFSRSRAVTKVGAGFLLAFASTGLAQSPVAVGAGGLGAGQVVAGPAAVGQASVGRSAPARIAPSAGRLAPSPGRVLPSAGPARTAPLQPATVWRGQSAGAREGYVQQQPVVGRPALGRTVPATVTPPRVAPTAIPARAGFTAHSTFENDKSGRDDHRRHDFPRRYESSYRGPYPYYDQPSYGGYGYPYLFVQTYGYPFSALPFEPAQSVYNEPQVPSESAAPAPAEATPAPPAEADAQPDTLVQDVQSELIRRGYFAGKATGLVTKDFQVALRRFQQDQNLASSGLINQASLYALGLN